MILENHTKETFFELKTLVFPNHLSVLVSDIGGFREKEDTVIVLHGTCFA
jgi:hypothetical protein